MNLFRFTCIAGAGVVLNVSVVSAQNAFVAPMPAGVASPMRHDSATRLDITPVAQPQSRSHHVSKGAKIGAVSLGLIGLFAGSQAAVGCDTGSGSACHADREHYALMLYGSALGATAGGILGSLVGFAWPVRHSGTSTSR